MLSYVQVGNEPDKHGRCTEAYGQQAGRTVRDIMANISWSHPNVKLGVGLPTNGDPIGAGQPLTNETCWRDFARGVNSVGTRIYMVGPHFYTSGYFNLIQNVRAMDLTQELFPGVRIYATEMNVNAAQAGLRGNWTEVARRINYGVNDIFWWRDGVGSATHRDSPVVGFTVFVYDRSYGVDVDRNGTIDGGRWCNPTEDYAFDAAYNGGTTKDTAKCEPLNFNGANVLGAR